MQWSTWQLHFLILNTIPPNTSGGLVLGMMRQVVTNHLGTIQYLLSEVAEI